MGSNQETLSHESVAQLKWEVCLVRLPDVGFWPCVKSSGCHGLSSILREVQPQGFNADDLLRWLGAWCNSHTLLGISNVVFALGDEAGGHPHPSRYLEGSNTQPFSRFLQLMKWSPRVDQALGEAAAFLKHEGCPTEEESAATAPMFHGTGEPDMVGSFEVRLIKQESSYWPCVLCNSFQVLGQIAHQANIVLSGFPTWYADVCSKHPGQQEHRLVLLLGRGKYSEGIKEPHTPMIGGGNSKWPPFVADPKSSYSSCLDVDSEFASYGALFALTKPNDPELCKAIAMAFRVLEFSKSANSAILPKKRAASPTPPGSFASDKTPSQKRMCSSIKKPTSAISVVSGGGDECSTSTPDGSGGVHSKETSRNGSISPQVELTQSGVAVSLAIHPTADGAKVCEKYHCLPTAVYKSIEFYLGHDVPSGNCSNGVNTSTPTNSRSSSSATTLIQGLPTQGAHSQQATHLFSFTGNGVVITSAGNPVQKTEVPLEVFNAIKCHLARVASGKKNSTGLSLPFRQTEDPHGKPPVIVQKTKGSGMNQTAQVSFSPQSSNRVHSPTTPS